MNGKSKKVIGRSILILILLLLLLKMIIPYTSLASEDIDGLIKKHNFTTHYYIELALADKTSTVYEEIAEVEYNEKDATDGFSGVTLIKIYFSNGGYLIPGYINDESIRLNAENYLVDQSGRDWVFKIIDKKPEKDVLTSRKISY